MFKPGDVVEWISEHHGGMHSLAVVTSHDETGVSVRWISMTPELQRECNVRSLKWERDCWSAKVFRKVTEIEKIVELSP